jgi:hypothetical protein
VTTVSRYTFHTLGEWEDGKAQDIVDHDDNVEGFIIFIACLLLLGLSDQECYTELDIYE